MRQRTILAWFVVHKWSSLVCTAFLLMLCVTGLPLIFHEEIDALVSPAAPLPAVAPGTRAPTLDRLVANALAAQPGEVPLYLSFEEERPVASITTAPRPDSPGGAMHFMSVDRRTGRALPPFTEGIMSLLLEIHTDLMLGLSAELFLGGMGVLFAAAIVSGIILYAPFMARLRFGTVRRERSARVTRLDRHNLLGIVTIVWALVVGVTGTLNTLATPLTAMWRADTLSAIAQGGQGSAPVPLRASVDRAVTDALRAVPGTRVQFVGFPGVSYSTNAHLTVFLQGSTPLTKRLLTPVFIDAATGRLDAVGNVPWYMAALFLAQPLHFGDYGGLPMKMAWALLDMLTIAVLWTGLRLWWARRARPAHDPAAEAAGARLVIRV